VNTDTIDNCTPGERTVLQSLRSNEDIIIKPQDKGSDVVMDKSAYIREAERQLSDDRFYNKLDEDPTKQFSDEITNELHNMYDNGDIDEETLEYLIPESPKPGRFHLLPKIHKANNPGIPIVSANGHPTENISGFVDFHLRQHVEALPFLIKDTTAYIQKMAALNLLPFNTTLVTMDVTSLNANIPHSDDIEACTETWEFRSVKVPHTDCLVTMLTMVLKKNNFIFNGDHYLQINGTAMAPSYANTFMGKFEKQLLESSIERPLSWYILIDDVDMKWNQSDEELQNFLSRANNLHHSIKFTHEISNTTISFLDTSSFLSECELSTDLYSKPTDTNQYLLPSSCHPPHVTKSIPYSQAVRMRRICSTDKSLKKRLGQLKNHLKRRGYKQSIIKKSFSKAHDISRSSLLQHKEKQKCKRTPCVLTYHPRLKNSFNTIREHWTSVEKNSKLSKVFPETHMVAFKQPNSLRNLLLRAEMSRPNTAIGKSHSCGNKRCKCCRHM
jgi:peptide-methionine (R)-S-oxide reductase